MSQDVCPFWPSPDHPPPPLPLPFPFLQVQGQVQELPKGAAGSDPIHLVTL